MKIFNLEKIKNSYFKQENFVEGVLIYNQNSIKVENVAVDKTTEINMVEAIVEEKTKEYKVFLGFKEKNGSSILMGDRSCTCNGHLKNGVNCSHMAALVLSLNNYSYEELLTSNDVELNTSQAIKDIESVYIKSTVQNYRFEDAYNIYPMLFIENNEVRILFKLWINRKKNYILTNLEEFIDNVRAETNCTYGKNLLCKHGFFDFDETSQLTILYIESRLKNEIDKKIKTFVLVPSDLKIILNVYKNQKMGVKFDHYQTQELIVENKKIPFHLNVKEREEVIEILLIQENERIHFFDTIIFSTNQNSIEFAEVKDLKITEFIKKSYKKPLTIVKEDFFSFYDNALRHIAKYITVNTNMDFTKMYDDMPSIEAFLDVDSKNKILLTINVMDKSMSSLFQDIEESKIRLKKHKYLELKRFLDFYFYENNKLFVSKSTEMVYNFRKLGIEHLVARVDKLVTSKKYNQMKIIKNPSINIGVKVENNFLELMMNIDQTKRDEFAKILKAYESKESYIQMENGNFLEINEHVEKAIENLKTGLNLTTDMLAQPDLIVGKQQAFYIEYFLKKECRYNVFNDEKFHSILNEITSIEITQEKQPVNLNGTLKKYQLVGYNKLKTMKKHAFGMMLADDMGLGKTIQVIAYLLDQKNNGNTFSFIICPSSLILNWEKEFAKFAPTLNVLSINLDGSKRDAQFQKMHQYDILITSYDLLKRDIANYLELKFDNLIIDEAHYIKNSMTQNYKTVKKINADTRIALTGTPIENRLSELWAIMNFIVPGYLSNYKVFNAQFETPIELYDDRERLELLQKLCFPFILRRMKKDVLLELPNKTEIFIYAKMEEKQENLYYANLVKMKEELRELEITTSKLKILSMLMKLRQLASDPTLVHKEYNGNSAKLEVLMELIDSISEAGAKVLVFSQFTSMLSIVKKKLEQKGISNFLLTGATKKDKRQELVEKFNKDKTTVFLISLKAGGSGLNLTGAENVIHFDPWWNLSTQNQATDRVYRIGQEKNVTVYKLITSNTIEEKIVKMQDKKGKLASSILDGKLEGFSSISEEDLIKLFD